MLTFEKVLEGFRDYLVEDKFCEVLRCTRGYMVVNWNNCEYDCVTAQLCRTPDDLRDILRFGYADFQGFRLTDGYKRDLTDQEAQDIERKGLEIADRCEETC